jgi:hypothetical protein
MMRADEGWWWTSSTALVVDLKHGARDDAGGGKRECPRLMRRIVAQQSLRRGRSHISHSVEVVELSDSG